MNTFLTNVIADLGYEKLIQLQYEMILSNQRVAEMAAIICMTIQKFT
jgi:hypothetical protein